MLWDIRVAHAEVLHRQAPQELKPPLLHCFLPHLVQVSLRSCTPALTKVLGFGLNFRPHLMLYKPGARVGCQQLCKAQGKPLYNDCLDSLPKGKDLTFSRTQHFLACQLFIVHWQVPSNGKVKGMSFKWSCLHVFWRLWSMGLVLIFRDSTGDEEAHSPLARDPPGFQTEGSKIALRSCFLFFSVMLKQCLLSFTSISPLCLLQLYCISPSLFLLFTVSSSLLHMVFQIWAPSPCLPGLARLLNKQS